MFGEITAARNGKTYCETTRLRDFGTTRLRDFIKKISRSRGLEVSSSRGLAVPWSRGPSSRGLVVSSSRGLVAPSCLLALARLIPLHLPRPYTQLEYRPATKQQPLPPFTLSLFHIHQFMSYSLPRLSIPRGAVARAASAAPRR